MKVERIALALIVSGAVARGQTHPAFPRFDVASIRACKGSDAGPGPAAAKGGTAGGAITSPLTLYLGCRTLETLIQFAYLGYQNGKPWIKGNDGFPEPPVSMRTLMQPLRGGPKWIQSEKFTIEAKSAEPQAEGMMRGPMMQALLEERFRLRLHREIREVPVYLLTVANGGPRLQPASKGSCIPRENDAEYAPGQAPWCGWFRASPRHDGEDTFGQTMVGLCTQFSAELDRDVIDKTGIRGRFDIHLEEIEDDLSALPDPFARISGAIRPLGLKLEPGKGAGVSLVIDQVERPSEN